MYKIIIADDESTMRTALQTLIDWAAMDCEVIFAAQDGQSVLEHLSVCKPDIIISDIKMPRMDGLQLAKQLYQTEPQIKLILLTAFADFSYAQQAVSLNVVEYVIKSGALDTISSAVEKCKRQLESAQKIYRESSFETNGLLRAVMGGAVSSPGELSFLERQLPFKDGPLTVLLLKQRDSAGQKGTDPLRAARLLRDMLRDMIYTEFPFEVNTQCFLLCSQNAEELTGSCRRAASAFYDLTRERLYIGISEPCSHAGQFCGAVEQCRLALENSFYDAVLCVNLFCPRDENRSVGTPLQAELIAQLSGAVRIGAASAAQEVLTQLFAAQKQMRSSPVEVRRHSMEIMELCKQWSAAAGAVWSDENEESTWKKALEACEFFTEYRGALQSLVKGSCADISTALQTHGDLVLRAQDYIAANFKKELSLSDIAFAVGANPSYLSRAFKAKTGMSVVNTITQKRMEVAKQLLEKGALQIQEIASIVGMENTTYFSHLFRKYAGMSPKTYQERAAGRERSK